MSLRMNIDELLAMALLGGIPLLVVFTCVYWEYMRLGMFRAFVVALVTLFASVTVLLGSDGAVLRPGMEMESVAIQRQMPPVLSVVAWIVLWMSGVGLMGKIYRAWILDQATEAE